MHFLIYVKTNKLRYKNSNNAVVLSHKIIIYQKSSSTSRDGV